MITLSLGNFLVIHHQKPYQDAGTSKIEACLLENARHFKQLQNEDKNLLKSR